MDTKRTYSYHDQDPGTGAAGKGWVVIAEETDEHGDVVDTDLIKFCKTEAAAVRSVERLRKAQAEDDARGCIGDE